MGEQNPNYDRIALVTGDFSPFKEKLVLITNENKLYTDGSDNPKNEMYQFWHTKYGGRAIKSACMARNVEIINEGCVSLLEGSLKEAWINGIHLKGPWKKFIGFFSKIPEVPMGRLQEEFLLMQRNR